MQQTKPKFQLGSSILFYVPICVTQDVHIFLSLFFLLILSILFYHFSFIFSYFLFVFFLSFSLYLFSLFFFSFPSNFLSPFTSFSLFAVNWLSLPATFSFFSFPLSTPTATPNRHPHRFLSHLQIFSFFSTPTNKLTLFRRQNTRRPSHIDTPEETGLKLNCTYSTRSRYCVLSVQDVFGACTWQPISKAQINEGRRLVKFKVSRRMTLSVFRFLPRV